jgi:hypothetical protein
MIVPSGASASRLRVKSAPMIWSRKSETPAPSVISAIGAVLLREGAFLGRAGPRDHRHARRLGELDHSRADAARSTVHINARGRRTSRDLVQHRPGDDEIGDADGRFGADARGQGNDAVKAVGAELGIAALLVAPDQHRLADLVPLYAGTERLDAARHLVAGDRRQGRHPAVLAAPHQIVGLGDADRPHAHQHLPFARHRIGKLDELQDFRPAGFRHLNGFHGYTRFLDCPVSWIA